MRRVVRTQSASHRLPIAAAAAVLVGMIAPAPAQESPKTVQTAFWQIDPEDWHKTGRAEFPERQKLDKERPQDVGVAFSGGGTRSAAATIGQLRGLRQNGWLDRVRYVTAVSGGSWAAVPYTFYDGPLEELLGEYVPTNSLTPEALTRAASGKLAERVARSELGHVGLQEVPQFLPDRVAGYDTTTLQSAVSTLRRALRKWRGQNLPEPDRRDKSYAHMLGQVFLGKHEDLDPLVARGNLAPYTWDRETAIEMSKVTGYFSGDFVHAAANRPFLIVGGTLIWQHPAFTYPRLIPVEYTPLYTGIRQRFGGIGGTYVWPWAYDRSVVARQPGDRMLVSPGPDGRMFTLADVIASSGAAPQLTLLLGTGVPSRLRASLRTAAEAFPSFANTAVRDGEPIPTGDLFPHGDGGFTDNFGLMPLLARQVRNIIVFVNSNKTWTLNDQLQSFFIPVDVKDGGGDKSMNAVFEASRYKELLDGLDAATASGGPAVYCGRQAWSVHGNELYNIRTYDDLKICWVYNHAAGEWKKLLDATIRGWLDWTKASGTPRTDEVKALESFPYYATFGENRPRVIRLNPLQINLLADLAAWSITNTATVDAITGAFGEGVLPKPTR